MKCPYDQAQCEYPRCLNDDPQCQVLNKPKSSVDVIQQIKLDAALSLMEGLQAQGITLHGESGKALTKDEFITAMCKAMDGIL